MCGWLSQTIAVLTPQRFWRILQRGSLSVLDMPSEGLTGLNERDVFGDGGGQLPSLHTAPLAHTRPWCPRAGISGCVLMELCHNFLMFSQVLCDQGSRFLCCGFVCLFKYIYIYLFLHSFLWLPQVFVAALGVFSCRCGI